MMQIQRTALVALTSLLLGGLVTTMGCGSAATDDTVGEDVTVPDTTAFRGRWRYRRIATPTTDAGGAGGQSGTTGTGVTGGASVVGPAAGCDICTKAQQCCQVVTGGDPVCTFNAATCSAMDAVGRDAYVNNCLVFINAAVGARVDPPAECR